MQFKIAAILFLIFVSSSFADPTPIRTPSFGPNGSHWPGQISGLVTPYMYDESVPHKIIVDPDWEQIASTINSLTATQVSQGVLVLVKPGVLVGKGGSPNNPPSLLNVGNSSWTKRVTIAPRDGWGTVTMTDGIKFDQIRNLCFAGFTIEKRLRVVNSTRFAFARVVVNANISIHGDGKIENDPKEWEFVELVKRKVFAPDPTDPVQLQVFSNTNKHIQGVVWDGSYLAPNYMPTDHSAHQDTIQHLANDTVFFQNETFQDTVVFASNRCAINGGFRDTVFRNCWLNSRKSNQTPRYPVPSGAVMESNAGVNQGSVSNVIFDGGYVMGKLQSNQGIDERPYHKVMNGAKIDVAPGGYAAPEEGHWIVDPTLNGHTNPGYPPDPTDEYLEGIWGQDTSNRARTPVIIPGSDTFDSAQSVSMSCATANSKVYYTLDGSTPNKSSLLYTNPLSLSEDTTVKAFCTASGLADSYVSASNFVFKVADPVISAGSLSVDGSLMVNMSVSTAGAKIHYTLDGTDPTQSSQLYSAPIRITESKEFRAIAVKAGISSSDVVVSNIQAGSIISRLGYINLSLPQPQSDTFTIEWNAVPSKVKMDGVMGLSHSEAVDFTNLSAIVRFNKTEGVIDARDAGTYKASKTLTYVAGKMYHFKLVVDVKAGRYSVIVTPEAGSAVEIAKDFLFRTEANNPESLDFLVLNSPEGEFVLSGIAMSGLLAPSAPGNVRLSQ